MIEASVEGILGIILIVGCVCIMVILLTYLLTTMPMMYGALIQYIDKRMDKRLAEIVDERFGALFDERAGELMELDRQIEDKTAVKNAVQEQIGRKLGRSEVPPLGQRL